MSNIYEAQIEAKADESRSTTAINKKSISFMIQGESLADALDKIKPKLCSKDETLYIRHAGELIQ